MSPHIMLHDTASISCTVEPGKPARIGYESAPSRNSKTALEEFISSVKFALAEIQINSGNRHHPSSDHTHEIERQIIHEATDIAHRRLDPTLLPLGYKSQSRGKVNRFEVMRNGVFIATILLGRPSFRLGETIPVVVDLQNSDIRCYSLTAILENSETIDGTIALRSPASIYRATRRVYASQFELMLFAKRASFSPIAPSNATPNFQTSGVSLVWTFRFEFMISKKNVNGAQDKILDEIDRNERGSVSTAVKSLSCEKFEVTVPLNVHGCTLNSSLKDTIDEFSI